MNIVGPIFDNLLTLTEKMPPGMGRVYQNLMFIHCNVQKQLKLKESQIKPKKCYVPDTTQFVQSDEAFEEDITYHVSAGPI